MENNLYQVKLTDIFEGPMDLLVHLIKKNEVDIYDIPIAVVTEQYLTYAISMIRENGQGPAASTPLRRHGRVG